MAKEQALAKQKEALKGKVSSPSRQHPRNHLHLNWMAIKKNKMMILIVTLRQ
jgi:hypothetical protein